MATKQQSGVDEFIKAGALMMGDDERLTIERLPTGIPALDKIIGGGFAYRRNVLCVGPESTGKTLIAQHLIAAQQRTPNGRTHCLLIDAEMSYDPVWWAAAGVDTAKLYVSQPTSGEQAVNLIVSLLKSDPELGVIVLDSIATLSPTVVQEKLSGERTVASLATLVTDMYQKIMPANRQAIFFAINQLRENMSGYEDIFPGGRAQRFNSHLRLHTRRVEWLKERDERVGYVMEIHVRKNKVGEPEGITQLPVRFQGQFDLVSSYIDEALEYGLIRNAGPYYEWRDAKWLGKSALRAHFIAEPAQLEALQAEVANHGR